MSVSITGEVSGRAGVTVHFNASRIISLDAANSTDSPPTYGHFAGAIVPVLWDHHLHLRAWGARMHSVDLSGITDRAEAQACLRQALPDEHGWIRAVGYDDDILGVLDRERLDSLTGSGRSTRVQHRSGHQWVVNTAGLHQLRASMEVPADGVWWGDLPRLGSVSPETLANLAETLRRRGVFGVTDMTATGTPQDLSELRASLEGRLDLRC